ncbi:MAG: hypothetical protein LBQ48_07750 [Oscillospiraceae bacterium]|jgi:hypothetical protein|nr:hypothetical protein [Oscillospiraceae bacterium]
MKISSSDNKRPDSDEIEGEMPIWLNIREEPFRIFGLLEPQKDPEFRRIPREVAESVNPGVLYHHTRPSGGRVRFKTDSPYVAIRAEFSDVDSNGWAGQLGLSGLDIYRFEDADCRYYGTFLTPDSEEMERKKYYEAFPHRTPRSNGKMWE